MLGHGVANARREANDAFPGTRPVPRVPAPSSVARMARPTLPVVLLCTALASAPLHAAPQDPPAVTSQAPQGPSPRQIDATTLAALERLATQQQQIREVRDRARAAGDTATVLASETQLRELGWQFAGLATRLDVQNFESPQKREFDLQREVEDLIRPLIETIKEATEEPRQIAEMRTRIELLQLRQRIAEDAQRNAEQTRAGLPPTSPAVAEIERELRERWRPTIETLRGEILVLRARLQAREEGQTSLVDGVSKAAQNFMQSSGTSLALAIVVFGTVFFGLRFLLERLLQRSTNRGFSQRLIEVTLQGLSLVLAISATLVVPYARNDWLLLAVCIVFLIGAGWVLVRMLPQFFEQIRLVLNVGGVREGERILVDGLPFRVASLRLYSRLENPDLQGGSLRVPIQYLIGKRSRRSGDGEPWFPCQRGDVVLLQDGTAGAVLVQTPEVVVIENFGAPCSFPTTKFLEQNPRNLSRGFVVTTTFGIDYRHQKDVVPVVAPRMREALHEGLSAAVARGELVDVRVEFQVAGASSLDLLAMARFTGSAAPRFFELQRRMQALLVTTCTANGWTIPFPQIVVHPAAS